MSLTEGVRPQSSPVPLVDPSDERAQMRQAWRVLSVVMCASAFTAVSGTALNVALPTVVDHFDASSTAASWLVLSFLLANTLLLVLFGRLADLFGRREMYLAGLATFTLASLLSGLAPDEWVLVGLRVVQAAGAAMLLTNSAALITDAFPRDRLGQGMGIYLASFSIASLVGPALGGLLAFHAGWRWVFWFNVPLGLASLVWGALVLRRVERSGPWRGIDLRGNVLLLLALGSGLVALTQVTDLGWASPLVLGGLALSALLLPLFVWVQKRTTYPVVDVTLFRDRPFALGLLASFLNSVSQVGVMLLVSLYFQSVRGEDPVTAGLRVLPLAIATVLASTGSGQLTRWFAPRSLAVAGNLMTTSGLTVLLLAMDLETDPRWVMAGLALMGLGSGFFMPSNMTALMGDVPKDRLGIVNGTRLMLQNSGLVVGTAVALSVLTTPVPRALRQHVFDGTLSETAPEALDRLVTGYHLTLATLVGVSLVTCTVSFVARQSLSRRRPVPAA